MTFQRTRTVRWRLALIIRRFILLALCYALDCVPLALAAPVCYFCSQINGHEPHVRVTGRTLSSRRNLRQFARRAGDRALEPDRLNQSIAGRQGARPEKIMLNQKAEAKYQINISP